MKNGKLDKVIEILKKQDSIFFDPKSLPETRDTAFMQAFIDDL